MTDDTKWLTIPEAAAALGKSQRTIQRMISTHRLPTMRRAGRVLVGVGGDIPPESDIILADQLTVRDKVARLQAELDRVKATLAAVISERDYLRAALEREQTVTLATLTTTRQIDAPRGSGDRPWWKFW